MAPLGAPRVPGEDQQVPDGPRRGQGGGQGPDLRSVARRSARGRDDVPGHQRGGPYGGARRVPGQGGTRTGDRHADRRGHGRLGLRRTRVPSPRVALYARQPVEPRDPAAARFHSGRHPAAGVPGPRGRPRPRAVVAAPRGAARLTSRHRTAGGRADSTSIKALVAGTRSAPSRCTIPKVRAPYDACSRTATRGWENASSAERGSSVTPRPTATRFWTTT